MVSIVRRALMVAVVLAGTDPVAAEAPATATLRWVAPSGCPDEAAVRARVDARLARPLGAGDSIDAKVTVRRERKQLHAHVVVWTPVADADRELVAGHCDELADAVAVVLARAVAEARALVVTAEAAELLAITVPPPSNEPRTLDEIELEPQDEPIVRRRPERDPASRDGGVRPAMASGAGLGPHVGFGVELGAWFVWDSFAGEVVATRWLERLAELPASQRFGAAIGVDSLAARACWNPARFGPRVCLLGETGAMSGRGVGLFDSQVGEASYSAMGVGVSLRARLRRHLALVGGFDMLQTVKRPRFVLDRGTVLHQPDPTAGRVTFGFEVGWR